MTRTYMYIKSYVRPQALFILNVSFCSSLIYFTSAGKATTDEELEEMLESGNAAVFTAGVSISVLFMCP